MTKTGSPHVSLPKKSIGWNFSTGFVKRDTMLPCQHHHSTVLMENLMLLFLSHIYHHNTPLQARNELSLWTILQDTWIVHVLDMAQDFEWSIS